MEGQSKRPMNIPLIDCDQSSRSEDSIVADLDRAFREVGFLAVRNIGIDAVLRERCFETAREFFALPGVNKARCAYGAAADNFGYQGLRTESLDPRRPADLKETFTMRNVARVPIDDARWPSAYFARAMHGFYNHALQAAALLQRWLSLALHVDEEFFLRCHSGENATLRLRHYPPVAPQEIAEHQLGAGAHTDYGMLTLLLQDDVGGLEVLDATGRWQPVDPMGGAVVINCGDLLERWTNGRYRSTTHRVRPVGPGQDRYSVALFVDPDSATRVEVLESCIGADGHARFAPTTAGAHLQEKIEATHRT